MEKIQLKKIPDENWPSDVSRFCRKALGIHAARVQTPYISFLSRNINITYTQLFDALNVSHEVIKIRCMRNTLHITSLDIANILHNATLNFRVQRCFQLRKHVEKYDKFSDLAEQFILKKMRNCGSIRERVDEVGAMKVGVPIPIFRLKLKEMWETGVICVQDSNLKWNKEDRYFCLTKTIYGDLLIPKFSHDEYVTKLAEIYFDRFGPATEKDFVWWSGLQVRKCRQAIQGLTSQGSLITMHRDDLLFFTSDLREENYEDEEKANLSLLAWEDFALKAYFQTRCRYGSKETLARAFNSIGEVKRTILHGKKVVGVWDVCKNGLPVSFDLFENNPILLKDVEVKMLELKVALSDQQEFTNF